jgi:sporulation protein YlmC with PRC-barrel domain
MINTKSLLLATCIAAVPGFAFAQSATQAPATSAPSATQSQPMSSTNTAPKSGAMAGSTQPLAMPSPNQMMGADLRGANVYTANNESIGDIKDIVLTRDGNVDAVIVGVGGFLGIGEKNVAIPFRAIEISENRDANMASTGAREPATTGSTATTTTSTTANTQGTIKPQRIVLRNMTKAELEAAPAFRADGGGSATGTSTTGGTMNNRTTAPAAPAAR